MSDFDNNDFNITNEQNAPVIDGVPTGNDVENSTVTFSENTEGYQDAEINTKPEKNGAASLVIGIIFTVVNCAMGISLLNGGRFIFGGLFAIVPIVGLVCGIKAFKEEGSQKIMGIIGFILNIFTTIGAVAFLILGIISKFIG